MVTNLVECKLVQIPSKNTLKPKLKEHKQNIKTCHRC